MVLQNRPDGAGITSIWLRILPYIDALALLASALFDIYRHGVTFTDANCRGSGLLAIPGTLCPR